MPAYYLLAVLIAIGGPVVNWSFSPAFQEKKLILPPKLPEFPEKNPSNVAMYILAHNLLQQNRGNVYVGDKLSSRDAVESEIWVLMAVGKSKDDKVALIQVNKEVRMYYAGDLLPDGRKLLQILADGIVVDSYKERAREYVYLFGKSS